MIRHALSSPPSPLGHLRAGWRLARLLLHVLWGSAIAALLFPALGPAARRSIIRRWSAGILSILNVRLVLHGSLPPSHAPARLFIANHVSWIDVWAIDALLPVRFVAKDEMRSWPLIGWLAEKAGTLFIRRGRRQDTAQVSRQAAKALQQGEDVCVFPEGTTTDGRCLYPFRSSLLQPAVEARAMVQPLALRYLKEDGSPDTAVSYSGDTTLAQSLRSILAQDEIVLHLEFAAPISPVGRHRRELARQAEQVIAGLARLPVRAVPGTASGPPAAPH